MTLKRAVAVLPGVGISLLPKLTCPMCWPAYAALLSALGLTFVISARYLFAVTAFFLTVSVAALAFRASERRGHTPAILGLIAGAVVLWGKFGVESNALMYSGLLLLITTSVWNSWPRGAAKTCPQCALSGDEIGQLGAKERQV
jgi:mercuric ion transport protein